MQLFDRRPSDGKPVIGRCATADLVQNNQRPLRRLIHDRRRFHHLHHEGRAPSRQIVGGPNPAEQSVNYTDRRRFRRHVTAHLRQDRDERVLPQERALARHIGAGHDPQSLLSGQITVVGDETHFARGSQSGCDHRVTPAFDHKGQ